MKRGMTPAFVFLGNSVINENATMKTTDIPAGCIQRCWPISPQTEGRITILTP